MLMVGCFVFLVLLVLRILLLLCCGAGRRVLVVAFVFDCGIDCVDFHSFAVICAGVWSDGLGHDKAGLLSPKYKTP